MNLSGIFSKNIECEALLDKIDKPLAGMTIRAHLGEREGCGVGVELRADGVHELLPVSRPHGGVAQVDDQRHRLLERVDRVADVAPHGPPGSEVCGRC